MLIEVKTLTGKNIVIHIKATDSVLTIKEAVEEVEGIPPKQQRFVAYGRILTDCQTAEDCFLTEGSVIHLVLQIRGS